MSGWPSLDHVDDRLLAEALRAGDPHALTQVCDAYAARLFDYCHALLRDQESATQTLHDALLAAQAHVGRLPDTRLFRAWLYALVRSASLNRLADPARPTGGHEAPEIEDEIFDPATLARREETRQLVASALGGLNGRQREAIDLVLRHELAPEELAGVLDLSTEQATELAWEAREQLDNALAAATMVRSGRSTCPSVTALVDPGEWPLSSATSRKLVRHLDSCPVCAEQRPPKAATADLLQVLNTLPVALLPDDLQRRVLFTATDPGLAAERTSIAQRAEPLDEWGWPTAVEPAPRRAGRGQRERDPDESPRMWPAIAAAACVVLIVGLVYLILPSSSKTKPSAGTSQAALPGDTATVSPDPSQSFTDSATPSPTKTTHSPSPTPTTTTHSPTPKVTPTRTKPTKTPAPVKGTLAVGTCSIAPPGMSCSLMVTAMKGSVHWQVTGTTNGLTAGGSGTLAAGKSTKVTVSHAVCTGPGGQGTVSFSPGGSATVFWTCMP